jgi:hypothetical protein
MFAKTIAAFTLAASVFGAEAILTTAPNPLTVHEWGTFTSVADDSGMAVDWRALGGKADLPCFVHRSQIVVKGQMYTRVRMETPVVYFYAHKPLTVSTKVAFPNGFLTEWYPKAEGDLRTLKWNVEVLPNQDLGFPTGRGDSHYYAARETDAAPLRAGDEQEKLLFYRGTGDFQPPARPRFVSPTSVEIKGAIGPAILFENRDGKIGWRRVNGATVERPEPGGNLADLRADLVTMLTDAGLYQKEAEAMVATWRDSWFEDGARLLYVVPRDFVDATLPLQVEPKPRAVQRVFMGRAEMLAPERREELSRAMETSDFSGIHDYGRFFSAFARQVAKFTTPNRSMQYVTAKEQGTVTGPCVE